MGRDHLDGYSSPPRLVAGSSSPDGGHFRVIAQGNARIVEAADRDALGDLCWKRIGEVYDMKAEVPNVMPGKAAVAILSLLDDLAAKRDAVAKTFDYSTGDDT